jgi:flagellar biosynthesis/type III secretory pathway M-ring protein FliF/YscJ
MIYGISTRIIAMVVAVIVLIVVAGLFVRSCDSRRSAASQARVERSQAEAASNSAADAIGTVARSGEAERASEDLTRTNDKEIRNAEGADTRVGAGVNTAGLRSLCRRAAYRDNPRCRVFQPASR